jgi:hypothetical protein
MAYSRDDLEEGLEDIQEDGAACHTEEIHELLDVCLLQGKQVAAVNSSTHYSPAVLQSYSHV